MDLSNEIYSSNTGRIPQNISKDTGGNDAVEYQNES
jgi:hypothetical protein